MTSHHFANKGLYSQSYGVSSSHVRMWEVDYKEVGHWRTGAFELWCWRRLFRVPWTVRRSNQPFNPKGNQPRIFIRRTVAEAETPILWPPDVKNWLSWKDPDAGQDWKQEKKGMTEDEMVGWHHRHVHHSMDMSLSKLREKVMDREASHPAGHGVTKSQTWLSHWTELNLLGRGGAGREIVVKEKLPAKCL